LRLATVEFLRGDAEAALTRFEALLADHPGDIEATLGACEALVDLGRADDAAARLEPLVGHAKTPDVALVAALIAEAGGRLEALARHLADARARRDLGYVAAHRNALHVSLHCAMTAYIGRPQAGPGAVGAACAYLAGQPAHAELDSRDVRALERFVGALFASGRVEWIEPLLEPTAERAIPGIGAVVEHVTSALEAKLKERR